MREDVKELMYGVLAMVLFAACVWLYVVATPDQLSGEADLFRVELQERGE